MSDRRQIAEFIDLLTLMNGEDGIDSVAIIIVRGASHGNSALRFVYAGRERDLLAKALDHARASLAGDDEDEE